MLLIVVKTEAEQLILVSCVYYSLICSLALVCPYINTCV